MGGLALNVIVSLCLTAGGDLTCAPQESLQHADLPKLIATRQVMFFIPFSAPGDAASVAPAKAGIPTNPSSSVIQLWVSQNYGRTWTLSGEVSAARKGFLCRVERDGEYWFVARTHSGEPEQMQNPPHAGVTPELRVLVDTQPPILNLEAWRGEAGQVCTRWAIDETCVQPESLQILYRCGRRNSPQNSPWQEVAVDRSAADADKTCPNDHRSQNRSQTNRINWCADADADFVEIRAKIVDQAGNTAISHAYVDLLDITGSSGTMGNPGNPAVAAQPRIAR